MDYKTASYVAIVKRITGWVIFIMALISTLVSLIALAGKRGVTGDGVNAVINDFIKIMFNMIRQNTSWLNFFWHNSPVPSIQSGFSLANIGFIAIFCTIFIGLALNASGIRMHRQVKYIRQNLEDHFIVEQAKGNNISKDELIKKVAIPHHSIFTHGVILYFWPIIFGTALYFGLNLLNW